MKDTKERDTVYFVLPHYYVWRSLRLWRAPCSLELAEDGGAAEWVGEGLTVVGGGVGEDVWKGVGELVGGGGRSRRSQVERPKSSSARGGMPFSSWYTVR